MIKRPYAVLVLILVLLGLSACTRDSSKLEVAGLDQGSGLPAGADIKLYLLVGQSNMAGRGEVAAIDRQTHPRVFMLTADNEWVLAHEPIHYDKPERIGVGPGLAFGKAMAEAHSGAIIGLIPSAVGGSSIWAWKAGDFHEQTGVYPYDDAIVRAKKAVESGGKLEAILWHLGDKDSRRDNAPLYANEIKRLAADFRRDLAAPEMPFLIGGLGDFVLARNTDAHTIHAALEDAPNNIENTTFVSTEGLRDKGDELHFSAASYRELGERYAKMLLVLLRDGAHE